MEDNEKSFLLDRSYVCPVCDKNIKAKSVKTNVAKFVTTQANLRPVYSNVDTIKYDVISCNGCGYTAMTKYFSQITSIQKKAIHEKIQANYKSHEDAPTDTYSLETALLRYKMAYLCSVTKSAKEGELGNVCLKMSWILEELAEALPEEESAKKEEYLADMLTASNNAYEHLAKARTQESYPIAGMDEPTLDYLLSYLGYQKGEYKEAMRYLSSVASTRGVNDRLKEKCYELKQLLAPKLKDEEEAG